MLPLFLVPFSHALNLCPNRAKTRRVYHKRRENGTVFHTCNEYFFTFFTGAVGGASGSLRGRAGANIRRTRALVERENEKFLAHVFPRPQRVAQQVRTGSGSDRVGLRKHPT